MRYNAILPLEFLAGTSIEQAAEDAQKVANLLRVGVQFEFNGVTCVAAPGEDYLRLVKNWTAELERGTVFGRRRFASNQWDVA